MGLRNERRVGSSYRPANHELPSLQPNTDRELSRWTELPEREWTNEVCEAKTDASPTVRRAVQQSPTYAPADELQLAILLFGGPLQTPRTVRSSRIPSEVEMSNRPSSPTNGK